MDIRARPIRRGRLYCALAVAAMSVSGASLAAATTVTVHAQDFAPRFPAFARVAPITDATLRAGSDGRLQSLDVVPGDHLQSGQRIGVIGGVEVRARLASDRARLDAARDNASALHDALDAQRQELAQRLSTHQAYDRAAGAYARARAQRVSALQTWRKDRALTVLHAPASGSVLTVLAHAGERVHADQALVRMQPADALQLAAEVYAPDVRRQLHVGMRGRFMPDDGSPAIAVRITQLPPNLHDDGGQPVRLSRDVHTPDWISGETGTVYLRGRSERRILVPTRALILDRGQWWVLLHTPAGDRRHAVTPGTRQGSRTVILKGLKPGMVVIVDHAYRRFHRNIAHRYQVQD